MPALTAGLVAGSVTGCSLLVPDEAVDAARVQWASLPEDARSALGIGEGREGASGDGTPTDLYVQADLHLPPVTSDGTLGARLVADCRGVVSALEGTGIQAFGELPLTDGVVPATAGLCTRGLALGRWAAGPVATPPGRVIAVHSLELGRVDGNTAELLGLTIDLDHRTLTTSSDAPPWSTPLGSTTPADFDRALAEAAVPTPWVAPTAPDGTVVFVVPAGTAVEVTATCGAADTVDALSVEPEPYLEYLTSISADGADFPADEIDEGHVNCQVDGVPGTATATAAPVLRYTPEGGAPVDVVVVRVRSNDPTGIATLTVAPR